STVTPRILITLPHHPRTASLPTPRRARTRSARFAIPSSTTSLVFGNLCGRRDRLLEETSTDFKVSGIGEEALLADAIWKLQHEQTINVVPRFGLQHSSDFDVIAESRTGSLKQRRDFRPILSVLRVIENQQPHNHFERHKLSYRLPIL